MLGTKLVTRLDCHDINYHIFSHWRLKPVYYVVCLALYNRKKNKQLQSNFNSSNIFRTMEIFSRYE